MSIFEVGYNQAQFQMERTGKDTDGLNRRLSTGRKINSAADDPIAWSKIRRSSASEAGLRNINDSLTLVAGAIRVADQTMETIGKHIGMMKADLEAIVKNYPPYPPGDPERAKYLRSFAALRDQIDRMTIPPRDEGARKIMADPAVDPEAGDWDVTVNESGGKATIHSREVHTGPTGLNIPALADTATDAEISAAIGNLDMAITILSSRRAGLGGDAAAVPRARDFNEKIAAFNRASGEKLEVADMNETAALSKSAEVRYALAVESARGLSEMQSHILELLG